MKVVLVTAIWGREVVSNACLSWHGELIEQLKGFDIDLKLLAVASTNEDYARAIARGWACVKCDNKPLGRKFNRVMSAVPKVYGADVEAVIVIGDDEYLTISYINEAVHHVRRGAEYCSAKTAYMIDGPTGRAVKYRGSVIIGGGRIVTAALMSKCKWQPWEDGLLDGLDKSFDRTLRLVEAAREKKITFCLIEEDGLMTIKTKVNMWSYDYLLARILTEDAEGDRLYEMYGRVLDDVFHGRPFDTL